MKKKLNLGELECLDINHDREWYCVRAGDSALMNYIWTRDDSDSFVNDITTGRWHKYGRSFWFEFEQDAVMFKLKYG